MRPEETTKCECCEWQGKWNMMLICAPKLSWEYFLEWLQKQNSTEEVAEIFIKDIRKNLKNYDKAGSKK